MDKPYAWVGYLVSGLLNMQVGLGMVLYLVDRTARTLQQKSEILETAHQHSSDFIHTMSHELRTPLNAIRQAGFMLGRLGKAQLSADQEEMLGIIGDQSNLMLRLVGDIVDYSRIESGLLTCHPEPADLLALVERAGRAMAKAFDDAGITLRFEIEDEAVPISDLASHPFLPHRQQQTHLIGLG